jgi:hypothetical protein
MSLSKLKKLHVIIIGSVLCVLAGVALFFFLIKPQQEAFKKADDRYKAAADKGNQMALDNAMLALNRAQAGADAARRMLDVEMRRRMPDLSFARRDTGMLSLWNEQIRTLGPMLESFARDKSVNIIQATFSLPPPPVNPNDPIFDQDVLVFPLGQVQAVGNFKELMNNVRRWSNCNRLVMVGPPVLQGTSPRLVVAYTVTCYVFPVEKGGAKIPMAGMGLASGQPGTY